MKTKIVSYTHEYFGIYNAQVRAEVYGDVVVFLGATEYWVARNTKTGKVTNNGDKVLAVQCVA